MIVGTKVEFENLADFVLRDYLGDEYESPNPINIQAFAKDYYKYAALGKTPTEIAEEDGVAQPSVFESIERAKAKIEKLKNK